MSTRLHADLTLPARVEGAALDWVASPAPGVHRRPIERLGDEVARLTSVVRYAPGATFPPHRHGGGEEFLVLAGVFSDESGHYPAGSYVRNGVGTVHAPFTTGGCTILVKLWWMHPTETAITVVREAFAPDTPPDRAADCPLYADAHEQTAIHALPPGGTLSLTYDGGLEVFVLQGAVAALPTHGWLRLPGTGTLALTADGTDGAQLYAKRGHLRKPPPLPVVRAAQ